MSGTVFLGVAVIILGVCLDHGLTNIANALRDVRVIMRGERT